MAEDCCCSQNTGNVQTSDNCTSGNSQCGCAPAPNPGACNNQQCANLSACPPRFQSLTDMKNYLKRRLGWPVVCVEIDDAQFDQIILDVVSIAHRYLYAESTYRDFIAFKIEKGKSTYEMPCEICDTVDFQVMSYLNDINVLFSPTNMLLYNDWVNQGNYPGGPGSNGASIVSYDVAMMYFGELQSQFDVKYIIDYHEPSRTLRLQPTPKEDGVGLLECWKKARVRDLLDHVIVKELCYARCLQQWGLHLSKYQITMSGGASVNGQMIYDNGTTLWDQWFERMVNESYFPQFWVG